MQGSEETEKHLISHMCWLSNAGFVADGARQSSGSNRDRLKRDRVGGVQTLAMEAFPGRAEPPAALDSW
jgi:hypothetical protein